MNMIATLSPGSLRQAYDRVRANSLAICAPLEPDDYGVQTMAQVSPPKWHLAHITWYFETFVLQHANPDATPFDPRLRALFNSYYQGVGVPFSRPRRGALSRPTLETVRAYRAHVDARMYELLDADPNQGLRFRIELGLQHEQQHQELLLMDIKHILGTNPLREPYQAGRLPKARPIPLELREVAGGAVSVGYEGDSFCFDNERPAHTAQVAPYRLANRLVTNAEYLEFMEDDGYARPEFWLADGWTAVHERGWKAPLYWAHEGREWREYTLLGDAPLSPHSPLVHVSYYEADAFARWKGLRLPTEQEWEHAARLLGADTGTLGRALHPRPATGKRPVEQLSADVWQWTQSPYTAYPGFRPFGGALGEYNGKFMCNQLVLRGGSFATPDGHSRLSYRNFFYPYDRWAFSGVRLASDA